MFLTLLMFIQCYEHEDLDNNYAADLLKAGEEAPDFIIMNGDSLTGKPFSSFRGKCVVLDFWASWCPDCQKAIHAMKELNKTCTQKDIVFIGVSFDTDKSIWHNFIKENDMKWIHHSELKPWKETVISKDYKIEWLPTVYLIDKEGKVILGTVDIEKLKTVIEQMKSTPEI